MLSDLSKKHESKTQSNSTNKPHISDTNISLASDHSSTQNDSNPSHSKATRALINFYRNQYHAQTERLERYLTRNDSQALQIVENTTMNIVRILSRLDELGGAK